MLMLFPLLGDTTADVVVVAPVPVDGWKPGVPAVPAATKGSVTEKVVPILFPAASQLANSSPFASGLPKEQTAAAVMDAEGMATVSERKFGPSTAVAVNATSAGNIVPLTT